MGSSNVVALLCICVTGLLLVLPCCCEPPLGPDDASRPNRPKVFTSPDELRTYLEKLSNYYAIAGRPRFGKRAPPKMADAFNYRYPQSTSDMYDLLLSLDE